MLVFGMGGVGESLSSCPDLHSLFSGQGACMFVQLRKDIPPNDCENIIEILRDQLVHILSSDSTCVVSLITAIGTPPLLPPKI